MDFEIQTYWNVDTLYYVFNAVASLMQGAGWSGLIKFTFLVSLVIMLWGYLGRTYELAMWFLQAFLFVTILNLPVAKVVFSDKTGLEPPRSVSHVPFALAFIGEASTLTFSYLTEAYETTFGVPDGLGIEKGDVAFGHRILRQVNTAVVRDPALRADLMQFFKECTKYDILDGAITPDQIVNATDTWSTIFGNTSPARFVTYNVMSNKPVTDTCTNVAALLNTRVTTAVTDAQAFYGRQAFPQASSDALAQQMFMNSVSTSYSWLLESSQGASDAMKQAMFNNLWRDAGTSIARAHNDPAAIGDTNALIAEAEAARQANGSNSVLSLLGQETIPHMRNWIEAILYGLFPVVFLTMIIVPQERAKTVLGAYFMALVWIGLWPLLFAIINQLSLLLLQSKLAALKLSAGVPFQLSGVLDSTIVDEQAMVGYMVVLVPFIAGAIVKLGSGEIIGLADRMISGFSSAGSRAGAALASGNLSMGQAGIDTASVNTTSMQKYDSNQLMNSGTMSTQLSNGSTMQVSSNGRVAYQQFASHWLTQLREEDARNAGTSSETFSGTTSSAGWSSSARSGSSIGSNESFAHATERGMSQGISQEASTMTSGGTSSRSSHDESLGSTNQRTSGFGSSIQAQDSVSLNAGVGGNLGINASTGSATNTGGRSGPSARDQQRVTNAMRQGGASEQQVGDALKNMGATNDPARSSGISGGAHIQGGAALTGVRNYSADQTLSRSAQQDHRVGDSVASGSETSQTGSTGTRNTTGEQSSQSDRHDRGATRSNFSESAFQRDHGVHSDAGSRRSASVSDSTRHAIERNLADDPDFMMRVAQRNGIRPTRLWQMSDDKLLAMSAEYLDWQAMAQNVSAGAGSGGSLEAPKFSQSSGSSPHSSATSQGSGGDFESRVSATGFGSTDSVQPNMSAPTEISSAQSGIDALRNPASSRSLENRAKRFDEDVHTYASPDRVLGEGRVTQTEVNAASENNDVNDEVRRIANAPRRLLGIQPDEEHNTKDVPPGIRK